ncbi:MAG TPA: RNase adapter RapZ [Burkholderiaceae bacterium]|nr:RNase adapter RapZ [Burkholderiaceae bacterium]
MSLELILITGMSGSGKSVALHALEDAGFYCVDNLPPELLLPFIDLEQQQGNQHIAIAMDIRSAASLHLVPDLLAEIAKRDLNIKSLFLDATTDTLVRRYSETRRKHPLSTTSEPLTNHSKAGLPMSQQVLVEAINSERELLADLRDGAHVIDTSNIRPAQLLAYVKSLITAPHSSLTLVFESFAYKRGIPINADYVFDVRMLPNPHYEPALRALTGRDEGVQAFLKNEPEVMRMQLEIMQFIHSWLPALRRDHRSYVTIAIGCTGGQHRSVYLVEQLARAFTAQSQFITLKRHRELINQ